MTQSARVVLVVLVVLAGALTCLTATAVAQPAASGRKRVIISTDFGLGLTGGWRAMVDQDDGWAVGMALAENALNVALVATVVGNSNVAAEDAAAAHFLGDILRSPVRRASGAALKLDDPQATLNGAPLTRDCWNGAVQAMREVLDAGRATILALGPLTDVACLALNAPATTLSRIDEVIVIMGRAPGQSFAIGPVSGLTDFNLVMDNRALEVLLTQTQIRMTFMEFSVTRQVLVPRAFVATLQNGTPLQRYVYSGTWPWIDFWQKTFKEDGFHPWDSNAVWYAAHPVAYTCAPVNYAIQRCAKDGSDPYNRLGGCAGHSAEQPPSLDHEAIQLWLGASLPPSRPVTACGAFANVSEQEQFERAVRAFLGR